MNLQERYEKQLKMQGDMGPYLPVLKEYGSQCNHITEMGFREGISAWGLLASEPKTFITYDILNCNSDEHESLSNCNFKFIKS